MRSFTKKLAPLVFALSLTATALTTGCAVHARVYDSYDHQYRAWAPENSYYIEWEHDTNRSHEDFKKRSSSDQEAYWEWRHDHQ